MSSTPPSPVRAIACIALFASLPAAADVGLAIANVAAQDELAGGTASIYVGGELRARDLGYKRFGDAFRVPAGTVVARAVNAEGREIASTRLELEDTYDYALVLMGNGSDMAPYEFRLSADHNHPILRGTFSRQTINAAPVVANFGLSSLDVGSICAGTATGGGRAAYGDGTAESANVSIQPIGANSSCDLGVSGSGADFSAPPLASSRFSPVSGGRYRVFVVGDGNRQPVEAVVWEQRVERTFDPKPASAAIDGLWFDPDAPGFGVSVAYDPDAAEGRRVSAVYYGFDHDGRATWNFIETNQTGRRLQLVEYGGGLPDGTRDAIGVVSSNWGEIQFFSCTEAVLTFPSAEGTVLSAKPAPRNAIRLVKLVPQGCSNPDVG